jgi:hypothetical protein
MIMPHVDLIDASKEAHYTVSELYKERVRPAESSLLRDVRANQSSGRCCL